MLMIILMRAKVAFGKEVSGMGRKKKNETVP